MTYIGGFFNGKGDKSADNLLSAGIIDKIKKLQEKYKEQYKATHSDSQQGIGTQ